MVQIKVLHIKLKHATKYKRLKKQTYNSDPTSIKSYSFLKRKFCMLLLLQETSKNSLMINNQTLPNRSCKYVDVSYVAIHEQNNRRDASTCQ